MFSGQQRRNRKIRTSNVFAGKAGKAVKKGKKGQTTDRFSNRSLEQEGDGMQKQTVREDWAMEQNDEIEAAYENAMDNFNSLYPLPFYHRVYGDGTPPSKPPRVLPSEFEKKTGRSTKEGDMFVNDHDNKAKEAMDVLDVAA